MALVNFHAGTFAAYDEKRKASQLVETDLYFITDGPQQLFRGSKPVTDSYVLGKTDPEQATMRAGVMYVNTLTGKITVFDGEAVQTIIPAHVDAITEGTTNELVTAKAVKDYVGAHSGGFTAVKYAPKDQKNHRLVFTSSAGETEVELPDGLANVQYDAATGKFTFTKFNGQTVEADTPLEKVLTDASYNPANKKLTLTFNTAGKPTTADIDMSSLVDTYVVNKAENSAITVANGENGVFTIGLALADASLTQTADGLKVNISTKENNALHLEGGKTQGLYVAMPDMTPYAKKETLAGTGTSATDSGAAGIGVNGKFAGGANVQTILTDHETKITAANTSVATLNEEVTTLKTKVESATTALTWQAI